MKNSGMDNRFRFATIKNRDKEARFTNRRVGYFRDAMSRFLKNKGSLAAGVVILFLLLFSVITPFATRYNAVDSDIYYSNCLPKIFNDNGAFFDGTERRTIGEAEYYLYKEAGKIRETYQKYKTGDGFSGFSTKYEARVDTYVIGAVHHTFTKEELARVLEYDKKASKEYKVMLPLIDTSWIKTEKQEERMAENIIRSNANYDYRFNSRTKLPIFKDGKTQKTWKKDAKGNYVYYETTGLSKNVYNVRLNYDNYYYSIHRFRPAFGLGSDQNGRDILTRLAIGGRNSLIFALCVSVINFVIGLIYGAIEGFYGENVDIVMGRIAEILGYIPLIVVIALLKSYSGIYFNISAPVMLFIAFMMTGWLGTASLVRMQFYRYKNQEYILASRTLGTSDKRLIFRHILPNSIGTIVTSSILMIPGVIFAESSLSYLGIIDFDASGGSSIGTMLAQGQSTYTTYPNNILWPALFISALMICFNLFGNGLRDAFNPQLRGSEYAK